MTCRGFCLELIFDGFVQFDCKSLVGFDVAKKRLIASLFLSFFVIPCSVFAQTQICEIKYGEGKGSLKRNSTHSFRSEMNHSNAICYQIGNEVDESGRSLEDKPIFACCR